MNFSLSSLHIGTQSVAPLRTSPPPSPQTSAAITERPTQQDGASISGAARTPEATTARAEAQGRSRPALSSSLLRQTVIAVALAFPALGAVAQAAPPATTHVAQVLTSQTTQVKGAPAGVTETTSQREVTDTWKNGLISTRTETVLDRALDAQSVFNLPDSQAGAMQNFKYNPLHQVQSEHLTLNGGTSLIDDHKGMLTINLPDGSPPTTIPGARLESSDDGTAVEMRSANLAETIRADGTITYETGGAGKVPHRVFVTTPGGAEATSYLQGQDPAQATTYTMQQQDGRILFTGADGSVSVVKPLLSDQYVVMPHKKGEGLGNRLLKGVSDAAQHMNSPLGMLGGLLHKKSQ